MQKQSKAHYTYLRISKTPKNSLKYCLQIENGMQNATAQWQIITNNKNLRKKFMIRGFVAFEALSKQQQTSAAR